MSPEKFKEYLMTKPNPIFLGHLPPENSISDYEIKLRDANKSIADCLIKIGDCDSADKLKKMWKELENLKSQREELRVSIQNVRAQSI